MRSSKILILLSWLIVVLALLAAGAGLFWPGEDGAYLFTTLRGETAEMYRKKTMRCLQHQHLIFRRLGTIGSRMSMM
jgi:hypothetical protein